MTYADTPIGQFLDAVASARVVPAGGSAAAVVGATGAALCEMACIHTIEKAEYADAADELTEVRTVLEARRSALLDLADRDAAAVDDLFAAAGDGNVDAAAKRATGVPLAIAEGCLGVVEQAVVVTAKANPNAVPDAAIGAFLAYGGLRSGVYVVQCNADQIPDAAFVEEVTRRASDVEAAGEAAAERVAENVGA